MGRSHKETNTYRVGSLWSVVLKKEGVYLMVKNLKLRIYSALCGGLMSDVRCMLLILVITN